tara:strand:- start:25263 stop:26039 length:777 start_codon:yes stop_codon:yes gene_type:complete
MKRHIVHIKAKNAGKFNYCKFGNYKDKSGRNIELIDINDQKTDGFEMFQPLVSLDITKKQDKRSYEFLKNHPLIGKFIVEDVRANEEKNAEGALKSAEAITKATSLSMTAMNDIAVLMGLDPDVDEIMLRAKIIQYANTTPEKFLELTNDIDQEYRVFLKKAEHKKVLSRINGVWKHGSLNIGLSDDQAIVWLKDNADVYALLRRQLRTGKPAVEEKTEKTFVEKDNDQKPQTLSSSIIKEMETTEEKPKGWFGSKKK